MPLFSDFLSTLVLYEFELFFPFVSIVPSQLLRKAFGPDPIPNTERKHGGGRRQLVHGHGGIDAIADGATPYY